MSSSLFDIASEGFGSGDIANLTKAMETGTGPGARAPLGQYPRAGNDANPVLRSESLDQTLRLVTYQETHLRMWQHLAKVKRTSTVNEINRLPDYSNGIDSGFMPEIGVPVESDVVLQRRVNYIKFMGEMRAVSLAAQQVTADEPTKAMELEVLAGTRSLLRKVELALFSGDSALSPLQWDGIDKQILTNPDGSLAPEREIDLRGGNLDEETIMQASLRISDSPNYGNPNLLLVNPAIKTRFLRSFSQYQRYMQPAGGQTTFGLDTDAYRTPAGDISIDASPFLRITPPPPTINSGRGAPNDFTLDAAGNITAGATVTIIDATNPAAAGSRFGATDAGDYAYYAVACNAKGKSAPGRIGLSGALAAGQAVQVSVQAPVGTADNATEWIDIYRTKSDADGGNFTNPQEARLIMRIPNPAAGPAEKVDLNSTRPFTARCYMFSNTQENMYMDMLSSLMRLDLGIRDTAHRFMLLMYASPVIAVPERQICISNVSAEGTI
jgi:hypothetical protein